MHGGQDRHVAEAAADVADQRQREVDDAPRQAADVHDLAGQHEERHRQQREAVGAVDHVLRQDLGVEHVQVHISATPQTSSANAIGMPSAMAPSSEKMKTARSCRCLPLACARRMRELLGFADGDQVGLGDLARSGADTGRAARITAAETPNTMPAE